MTDHKDFEANLAIFCDYENVAIGARDAKYPDFDINLCLERLLDKGKIVVKKAYSDWERYKGARRSLHEASFELIEIPHVSYSGKNSADIRLVVDALDLCYTKQHVDTFVIISGDSDFSPLVSKLRENAKTVIGLGVKSSSSSLLVDNCDEFIYYDDLVRKKGARATKKPRGKPKVSDKAAAEKTAGDKGRDRISAPQVVTARGATADPDTHADGEDAAKRREEAMELVMETVEGLFNDRGEDSVWGSMVKQTLKRKRPQFNESFHGYRSFNQLLEDAQGRGLLEIQKDDRSGGYIVTGFGPNA